MHALDVLNNRRSSRPYELITLNNPIKLRHTVGCSSRRRLYDRQVIGVGQSSTVLKTYVSHESTRVTGHPSPSILLTHCSRRTMLQFPCVVLLKQSYDSPTNQGETASVELPFEAGHLQNTVILGNGMGRREKQQTFHLVHFVKCLVKSDNALKSAKVVPVLCETHTRISSDARRCRSI